MQGTFATAEGYVLKAQEITQDFTSFMNLLNQPVDAVTSFAETLVTTLKVLRVFVKIGTRIPYAKVVCKPIEKVMKVAIKLLDKGKKLLQKGQKLFDLILPPLESINDARGAVLTAMNVPYPVLDMAADLLTQVAFCARGVSQAAIAAQEKLKGYINTATSSIDTLEQALGRVRDGIRAVANFKELIVRTLQVPLNAISDVLTSIGSVLDAFDFLRVVFTLRICFGDFGCVPTLEELGAWVESIFNELKKIPLVGLAIEAFEAILDAVMEGIFGAIDLGFPDFNLPFQKNY
jgi:hypothetical protein